MFSIIFLIFVVIYKSNQQDPSLYTNDWLEKYDNYRKIILENTEISNEDNLTPEIRLHLITPKSKLWNAKSKDSPFKDNPFFAFYWAGGQGLTRYILDHPEIVKGKRVLDLGSGCGATAIAAAKCGAKSVTANDIDPRACIMIGMNAKLNNVKLNVTPKDIIQQTNLTDWDVVLVSGVWYKYEELTLLVSKLKFAFNNGKSVYVGDPSGTIKMFGNEKEFKTIAEYVLSDYSFKLIGFKETEVLELRHYQTNEEKIVEKHKYLLDGLNMMTCVGIDMNSKLNRVILHISKDNFVEGENSFQNFDAIFIGDLFYDWRVMDPLLPKLYEACRQGKTVLLGDPSTIVKHDRYNVTTVAVYNMTALTTEWSGHTDTEVLLLNC